MKHFIALTDRLDIEKALKAAAFLIFMFKLVEIAMMLIPPLVTHGLGWLHSAWALTLSASVLFTLVAGLFQPLVLLALARIIHLKKRAVAP